MTDGIDGNNYSFRIFEDLEDYIATWDVLDVNAETAIVSSEFMGFDHVNVEAPPTDNQSAIYKKMLAKYDETDKAARSLAHQNANKLLTEFFSTVFI